LHPVGGIRRDTDVDEPSARESLDGSAQLTAFKSQSAKSSNRKNRLIVPMADDFIGPDSGYGHPAAGFNLGNDHPGASGVLCAHVRRRAQPRIAVSHQKRPKNR